MPCEQHGHLHIMYLSSGKARIGDYASLKWHMYEEAQFTGEVTEFVISVRHVIGLSNVLVIDSSIRHALGVPIRDVRCCHTVPLLCPFHEPLQSTCAFNPLK